MVYEVCQSEFLLVCVMCVCVCVCGLPLDLFQVEFRVLLIRPHDVNQGGVTCGVVRLAR